MSVLVAAQGELIDRIENHVSKAVEDTEAGVGHLKKAVKIQVTIGQTICYIYPIDKRCKYILRTDRMHL